MNENDDFIKLLVNISYSYYKEGLTQEEISDIYNISRSTVSKYLTRARDLGIVEVKINNMSMREFNKLEKELIAEFGLSDAVVVDGNMHENTIYNLGEAGARYLLHEIEEGSIVGISAGRTLREVSRSFTPKTVLKEVTFVPLVGGLDTEHSEVQANAITTHLAEKTNSKLMNLYAPILLDTEEAKDILLSQSFFKTVQNAMDQVDIAVVGIGGKPEFDFLKNAYLHNIHVKPTQKFKDVSGDICYRFIDDEGNELDCDWNKRLVSIDLSKLRDIPKVIGISGGSEKVDGILSVLNGKLIDILITDSETASKILKLNKYN